MHLQIRSLKTTLSCWKTNIPQNIIHAKYNTFTNTRYLDIFTLLTSSSRRVIFLCEETGSIVNTFYTVWLVFWALFHFNIHFAQTIFRALLHFELLFNQKEKVLIIRSRSHALDSTCLTKIALVKTILIIKACVKRNVFFTTAKHVLDFGMKLLKPFLKTGQLIDCKFQTLTDLKFSFWKW